MEILSVNSPEFKAYGKVIDNVDFAPLVEALKKMLIILIWLEELERV